MTTQLLAPASDARLILLPGVGADSRMFEPQRAAFPRLKVPAWPEARPRETLRDYTLRIATTIDAREPFALGGVSFGGMVAYELAGLLRPRVLVLIASARTPLAVPRPLRVLERVLRPLPDWLFDLGRPLYPLGIGRSRHLPAEYRRIMWDMLDDAPMRQIRGGCAAIMAWRPAADPPCPVIHIHGARDRVIRPPAYAHVSIADGGHLINMTHHGRVNQAIADGLEAAHEQRGNEIESSAHSG